MAITILPQVVSACFFLYSSFLFFNVQTRTKGLAANDLAEAVLGYYIKDWAVETELDPEELVAIDKAIAESEAEEQAGLPEITQHDMRAMLVRMVTEREQLPPLRLAVQAAAGAKGDFVPNQE